MGPSAAILNNNAEGNTGIDNAEMCRECFLCISGTSGCVINIKSSTHNQLVKLSSPSPFLWHVMH